MTKWKELTAFLSISLLVSALIYGDALLGRSLLAPLDIGPDVFEHYSFMDEEADGIPENHFISDQFVYDLPLQKVIGDAYDRGEVPWWDPFTYGGRPLLADAHINGTDPVRVLCYLLLPFELAYNWNYVLRGVLIGLGMFLLLRKLGIRFSFSAILGIVYSYAGWYFLFFGHPWIAGAFLYYPYLWLVWFHLSADRPRLAMILGSFLCAGVFFAGNLQSHLYLPTFAALLLAGKGLADRAMPYRLTGIIAVTGVCGALLASTVLWNQVEFFLGNERPVTEMVSYPRSLLNSIFLGASIFPWGTGTFRTLNLGSLFGSSGLSYVLFAGSLVTILNFVGFFRLKARDEKQGDTLVMCRVLVVWFFVMVMTPFLTFYYLRSGALVGMGMIILAGLTLEALCRGKVRISRRALKWGVGLFTMALIALQIAAFVVYPRVRGQVEEMVERAIPSKPGDLSMPALREFQIASFPREVSVLNPETTISAIAIALFFLTMWVGERHRSRLLLAALLLSSGPLLSYYHRFRPKHDIVLWEKLQEGGPSQKAVMAATAEGKRFDEPLMSNAMVLPFAYPAFYGVHAVSGYSALQPESIVKLRGKIEIPEDWQADVVRASGPGEELVLTNTSDGARFRVKEDGRAAKVSLTQMGLNRLQVNMLGEGSQNLVRTDTYYPGWSGSGDATVTLSPLVPCFTDLEGMSGTVMLEYRPISLRYTPYLMALGVVLVLGIGLSAFIRRVGTGGERLRS